VNLSLADADKIEDLNQLKTWLKTQDVRVTHALAARSTLRSLPILMAEADKTIGETPGTAYLLAGFRAVLTSGVASACAPSDMKKIGRAAQSAGDSVFPDAYRNRVNPLTATLTAADHIGYPVSASASRSFELPSMILEDATATPNTSHFASIFSDARLSKLDDPRQIFAAPLWPNSDEVAPLLKMWADFEARPDPDGIWSFWRDWYLSMLQGTPMDWDLQLQVALIGNAIWQEGPEAVAKEIERIQAQILAAKLPMAERIEANPDTGKYRAVPIPVENPITFSALLSQIEDALEDCLGGHNGLAERSGTVKKLNRVLTKYKDDPQNAELTLTRVAGSLRSQLHETKELADNEDNLALLDAVEEGARGIRANHPEVAKNREQLAQQAIHALTPEDKDLLQQALPVLAEISEPELADDFATDISELVNDALLPLPGGAPPLPGADATTRVFSRISKMALLVQNGKDLAQKGAEAFDSDIVKSVRLAGLAISVTGGIGGILFALVKVGLNILGVL
jgi:hypothetical protein